MSEFLERFVERMQVVAPNAVVESITFPSGALDVTIRMDERFVVIQYAPRHGFGVSEIPRGLDLESQARGFEGHDSVCATEREVFEIVEKMLSKSSGVA